MAFEKDKSAPAAPVNPYVDLPEKAFWKTAVAEKSAFEIRQLWTPKFQVLPKHKIITAGSCFAQHIGKALSARGYNWLDAEPAPEFLSEDSKRKFNYGVFSFRTGNIYTATALRQWVEWAFGLAEVPVEIWEKDGRFYDPFRPAIEPDGFASAKEVLASRKVTLAAIRRACEQASFFIFTMGLTESWYHAKKGYEYAMCPGTIAGTFDPANHKFRNHDFERIRDDLKAVIQIIRKHNDVRFLLTVSPVPLTATASGQHVLTATVLSKPTLRAVAGDIVAGHRLVDYFPSYEIITGTPYRSMFYEPNLRGVTPSGVSLVMDNFFHDQELQFGAVEVPKKSQPKKKKKLVKEKSLDDVVCEEEMLSAFAR